MKLNQLSRQYAFSKILVIMVRLHPLMHLHFIFSQHLPPAYFIFVLLLTLLTFWVSLVFHHPRHFSLNRLFSLWLFLVPSFFWLRELLLFLQRQPRTF